MDADAWEVGQHFHLGLLTGDPYASNEENQVTFTCSVLGEGFQQELVLVVADKVTLEMNALLGSGSKGTNQDMQLQLTVVVIIPECQVNGEPVTFLVDTGSSISILHHSIWDRNLSLKSSHLIRWNSQQSQPMANHWMSSVALGQM